MIAKPIGPWPDRPDRVLRPCPFQDIITHKLGLEEVMKEIDLVNNSRESVKAVLLPE